MLSTDHLYFVEVLLGDGPDDCRWEPCDSHYIKEMAELSALKVYGTGLPVRVTHKNKTVFDLVGA